MDEMLKGECRLNAECNLAVIYIDLSREQKDCEGEKLCFSGRALCRVQSHGYRKEGWVHRTAVNLPKGTCVSKQDLSHLYQLFSPHSQLYCE